jgi:DNA-binding transcriptional LysR family regulator
MYLVTAGWLTCRRLAALLGVTLFLRDHHAVLVTDVGRAYVEEAHTAVLHADGAVQAARAAGQDAEMSLNVGRTPYAGPFFPSTILAARLLLVPKLRPNLLSGFSCDLTRDVLTVELDAALVIEPPLSNLLTS